MPSILSARFLHSALLLCFAALLPLPAAANSCDAPDSLLQEMVCTDLYLGDLSAAHSRQYNALREQLSDSDSMALRRSARQLGFKLEACGRNRDCLTKAFTASLMVRAELSEQLAQSTAGGLAGSWRPVSDQGIAGDILLLPHADGSADAIITTFRTGGSNANCTLTLTAGVLFNRTAVWAGVETFGSEDACAVKMTATDDGQLEVQERNCRPYFCGMQGFFDGVYVGE